MNAIATGEYQPIEVTQALDRRIDRRPVGWRPDLDRGLTQDVCPKFTEAIRQLIGLVLWPSYKNRASKQLPGVEPIGCRPRTNDVADDHHSGGRSFLSVNKLGSSPSVVKYVS